MLEYSLNIIGSEWIIIIFIALILLLGTNRFPEIATKLGKTVGEYNKAKNKIQNEMKDFSKENLEISGPVKNEREKLDAIAKTIGVDSKNKTDDQLKRIITNRMGYSQEETPDKKYAATSRENARSRPTLEITPTRHLGFVLVRKLRDKRFGR